MFSPTARSQIGVASSAKQRKGCSRSEGTREVEPGLVLAGLVWVACDLSREQGSKLDCLTHCTCQARWNLGGCWFACRNFSSLPGLSV